MIIDEAHEQTKVLIFFLETYRQNAFCYALDKAKEIVIKMNIDPILFLKKEGDY